MAAVIEDEQAQIPDFLEQQRALEEERLRREEAARLLAEQDALAVQQTMPPMPGNFISQPSAEIDALQAAFNAQAQPTAFVPAVRESYTPDSAQYQAEVARAQRGSGFVSADVGPGGNVITPGYDPSLDFAALKAQQEATNLQRNQYVDSLIKGGATYAEAYRAGQSRHPQTGNDAMRWKVEQLASQQNFTPRRITSNGVAYDELKRGIYSRAPVPAPQKFVGGRASELTKIAADNIADQITSLRRRLEPGPTGILLISPEEAAAIKAEIAQKEKARVELFNTPEANRNVDQPSWLRMRDAFNAPPRATIPVAPTAATPAQAESIREQFKAGKLSREEAKKQLKALGYE